MTTAAERKHRVRNLFGFAVLVVAFGWASVHVTYQALWKAGDVTITGDKRIIRFAHWQLEGGIVSALDDACRLYEQIHPDVDVQQIEVPERVYVQWVRTQLMGRTAPDLIETGGRFGDGTVVRYFVPITDWVTEPNPYNTQEMDRRLAKLLGGDPSKVPDLGHLEGALWRETYVDGMEGGWREGLQDYYCVPLSVFTIRVFANKDLLTKATGDLLRNPETGEIEGPEDMGTFFEVCKRIEAYGQEIGETILPIAGSEYVADIFRGRYTTMATWDLLDVQDIDGDGGVSVGEQFRALATGDVDITADPRIAAGHKLLYEMSRHFNPGFMNAKREDSVFMFAQGKAVMMATGSWEAGTLREEAEGLFEIMAFDFPIPEPGQKYSDVIRYPLSEAGDKAGFPMSLSRFSKHPEVAMDFMHFLASRRINEWLNMRFRWFPAIRGSEMDSLLKTFKPCLEGVYGVFAIYFDGDSELEYLQRFQAFLGANPPEGVPLETFLAEHYKRFINGYAEALKRHAVRDFENYWMSSYDQITQTEQQLARVRARAMRQGLSPKVKRWLVSLVWGQVERVRGRAEEKEYLKAAKQQEFGVPKEKRSL